MTKRKRSVAKRKRMRKLPDPMLCLVFLQTFRGVIPAEVIADFTKRPFRKSQGGEFWTSWRRLNAYELGLVLRG